MADIAILIEGLEKSYGSFKALHGVDLEVRQGEILGFLGSNGAGKPQQFAASLIRSGLRKGVFMYLGLTLSLSLQRSIK